ncbi:hypothetical protein MLD52_09605 [Puniceicoccaceae bacterium K14]|nr:hypothetical protein [Puniceicoccaceae bacterium K14]
MKQISSTHPVISLRDGALKISVFENEGENGTYLSATFAKTYTKNGKPADGHLFSRHDLLPLSELARRAYMKINHYRELKKETTTNLSHEG